VSTSSCINPQNILFIILWNIPGKLHNPKYITFSLNSLLFVESTAFYSSPSLTCTLFGEVIDKLKDARYFNKLDLVFMFYPLSYAGSIFCNLVLTIEIHSSLEYKKHGTVYLELDSMINFVLSFYLTIGLKLLLP